MGLPVENGGHFGVVVHPNDTLTLFVPRGEKLPLDSSGKPITLNAETIGAEIRRIGLPFSGETTKLVGWGARSAAIRQETPVGDYVAVVKPLKDLLALPVEDDPHMNLADKAVIAHALKSHLRPSMCVLCDGIGNKPALLKVSKEIKGPTLAEYPVPLLLSDSVSVTNLIKLYTDVLDLAKESGVLVDLWGSLGSSFIGRIKNNISPTALRNVMVEYPQMSLPIIDVSAIPIYTRYDSATTKQKIFLHARTTSLKLANSLLTLWLPLINLREKSIQSPGSTEKQNAEYYSGFAQSMKVIAESGIDHRVVGSMAIAGLLNAKGIPTTPEALRPDGTVRDVDILCFAEEEKIQEVQSALGKLRSRHPYYPHIDLIPVPGKQVKSLWGLVDLPSNGLDEEGRLFKWHKDTKVIFSKIETDPYPVNVNGVQFNTIHPTAVAASYLVRTGILKPKDLQKVRQLCSTYNIEISSKFIDFARAIQKQYGFYQNLFVLRTFIDYWTNGHLVALSGKIRNLSHKHTT